MRNKVYLFYLQSQWKTEKYKLPGPTGKEKGVVTQSIACVTGGTDNLCNDNSIQMNGLLTEPYYHKEEKHLISPESLKNMRRQMIKLS